MSEERVNQAMQIILHAGDARAHCTQALKFVEVENILEAKKEMELANHDIVEAHKIQTNAITEETNGKKEEYSLLFAHAQDTLMTIYSEINIAKRIIRISEYQFEKISKIEKRLNILEEERNEN